LEGQPARGKIHYEFFTQVKRPFANREFLGERDVLIKTLMVLRGWQVGPLAPYL
jgi:hypothetical protein